MQCASKPVVNVDINQNIMDVNQLEYKSSKLKNTNTSNGCVSEAVRDMKVNHLSPYKEHGYR